MREQACWRSCYFKIQCLFGCLMTTCSAARSLLRLLKCIINVLPSSVGKIGTHTRPVVGYVGRCLFCIFKVSKIWFNLYLLELFLNTRQFSPYQPVMIIKARQSEAEQIIHLKQIIAKNSFFFKWCNIYSPRTL